MRRRWLRGVGARMALASMGVALMALAIIAVGVDLVARRQFEHLMMSHGSTQADATAMFQQTVGEVLSGTVVAAAVASLLLAALLSRYLAGPLEAMGLAARRLTHGDYSARVDSRGPEEVRVVADSFNRMASSLEQQEAVRRDFIAGAAHELLTPLTNLHGYLEGLRDGVIPAEPAVFSSLHEETERLVRLSRSLLALAEATAGARQAVAADVDLDRIVEATVDLARPGLERRHVTADVSLPRGLRAHVNPDHATQVLHNLLQNAARYADEGGRVSVRGARAGDVVRVDVSNTGPGIPAAALPRVFERFFTVDPSRRRDGGGSGLGLALVRQLVEAAGGEVGAASSGGVTDFWFTLPAAQ